MREPEVAAAARWVRLGRLLPREVRERIYDPAFADLLRSWLTGRSTGRVPFGVYAIVTGLGCLPIACRWALVRRGTLTRLGRALVFSLAGLIVAILLLRHFTQVGYGY